MFFFNKTFVPNLSEIWVDTGYRIRKNLSRNQGSKSTGSRIRNTAALVSFNTFYLSSIIPLSIFTSPWGGRFCFSIDNAYNPPPPRRMNSYQNFLLTSQASLPSARCQSWDTWGRRAASSGTGKPACHPACAQSCAY